MSSLFFLLASQTQPEVFGKSGQQFLMAAKISDTHLFFLRSNKGGLTYLVRLLTWIFTKAKQEVEY